MLFASFLQALDDLGLREQTAIAFVADHGESWGERFADKTDVKGTYHMHGATLYDEIVEVPLILAAPGRSSRRSSRSQVRLVDLMPTLLELGGAPLDGLDGSSLLPLADGSERGDRPAVIAATDKGAVSQLALGCRRGSSIHRARVRAKRRRTGSISTRASSSSRPDDVPSELRERLLGGARRRLVARA